MSLIGPMVVLSANLTAVAGVNGLTVTSEEGIEEGAEDTPLWCIQDESGGDMVSHPNILGSVSLRAMFFLL